MSYEVNTGEITTDQLEAVEVVNIIKAISGVSRLVIKEFKTKHDGADTVCKFIFIDQSTGTEYKIKQTKREL